MLIRLAREAGHHQSQGQPAVGEDRGETARALLKKARRFPIVVEHLKLIRAIPQTTVPVAAAAAWVGPTGVVLADLNTPLGRG